MGCFFGVPRVPQAVISRPRLTARLGGEAALTIVRGGQGVGKTVAVADWATQYAERSRATPGVWFTVDAESGTRFALWAALLQQLLDSELLGEVESVRALIAAVESTSRLRRLLSQVLSRLQYGIVLVIDNGHLIDDSDAVELSLDIAMVLQATPKLRVILIARGELELERGEHGVMLGTAVVAADELTLTLEETVEVMAAAGVTGDLDALAADLYAATDGHPLLVRGALIANEKGFVRSTLTGGNAMADAAAAAVQEIIRSRDWTAEARDFALATSIAEHLSVDLAIELSGRSDAEDSLNYLVGIGVGIWEMDAGAPVFVYVPALQTELRRLLAGQEPKRAAELHRTVARWSFEHGKSILALEHAVAAGDLDLAEQFLVRDWLEVARLHGARSRDLLGRLSKIKLRRYPLLTMLLAVVINASPVHQRGALEFFTLAAASAAIMGKSVPAPRRVLLSLVASVAQRLTGHHSAALGSAKRAISAYQGLTLTEHDQLLAVRATLFSQLGISAHQAGDLETALECYGVSAAEGAHSRGFNWLAGLSLQAGLLADLGRMAEVAPLLEHGRLAVWPPGWLTGYNGSYFQIAEAYVAMEERDFSRAHEHLDSLAVHMPTIEHWDVIIRVRGMVLLGEGRGTEAVALLRAELAKHGRKLAGVLRTIYDAHLALFEIANGDVRGAESTLRRVPRAQPLGAVARALLELGRDQPASALEAIDGMDLSAPLSVHALGNAYMVRTAALLRLGNKAKSVQSLLEATALMTLHGTYLLPLTIPRKDIEALARMARDVGLVHELAVLERGFDRPEALSVMPPRVQLSERELVVLRELALAGSIVEVAEALFVSTNTVKSQLRSLYRKLGVSSRADALVAGRVQGLIGESTPTLEA